MVDSTVVAPEDQPETSSWHTLYSILRVLDRRHDSEHIPPAVHLTSSLPLTFYGSNLGALQEAATALGKVEIGPAFVAYSPAFGTAPTPYAPAFGTALPAFDVVTGLLKAPARHRGGIDPSQIPIELSPSSPVEALNMIIAQALTLTRPGRYQARDVRQDTITSTSEHDTVKTALLALILEPISIPDPAAVRDYLQKHRDMVWITLRACKLAGERFDDQDEISLEVYSDPEIDDTHLALYIRSNQYNDAFMNTIDQIFDDISDRLADSSGWLNVTTDFKAAARR